MNDSDPQSPCISVCLLDDNDICKGCYRSAIEITDWFMASAEEKREILRRSGERMQAMTTIHLK